jgi:hypothetical protein
VKPAESSSSVREFAKKLSQLFSKGTPNLSDEKSDAASAQIGTAAEALQVGITAEQEKNPVLYNGSVELSFARPVNLQQIFQFYNNLKYVSQFDVLNATGMVDKNVTIKLLLKTPTPLIDTLRNLPEVEEVSDRSQEAENRVSGNEAKDAPSRRIAIRFSSKNRREKNHGS